MDEVAERSTTQRYWQGPITIWPLHKTTKSYHPCSAEFVPDTTSCVKITKNSLLFVPKEAEE